MVESSWKSSRKEGGKVTAGSRDSKDEEVGKRNGILDSPSLSTTEGMKGSLAWKDDAANPSVFVLVGKESSGILMRPRGKIAKE